MSRKEGQLLGPVLYRDYPIGTLGLVDDGQGISRVFLVRDSGTHSGPEGETPLTLWAAAELDGYFSGRLKNFTVPLSPCGTEFQCSVWQALRNIPYGRPGHTGRLPLRWDAPKQPVRWGRRTMTIRC